MKEKSKTGMLSSLFEDIIWLAADIDNLDTGTFGNQKIW